MLVQQKQNIKGFTLLEILVVVAIVGIVSLVGYPRLDAWVSKNRVKAEAEKITSLFATVTSQVERGYYPYAMIEFESGSPTVIKAKGVSQNSFNQRIKKPGAPAIACARSDFTGWDLAAGSAGKEWQEIGRHTMHEDIYLDKLTNTSKDVFSVFRFLLFIPIIFGDISIAISSSFSSKTSTITSKSNCLHNAYKFLYSSGSKMPIISKIQSAPLALAS